MPSLEEQFEQVFTEILISDSGPHLLEAEAVTDCVVNGESVAITLDLPPDDELRKDISDRIEMRLKKISGISAVTIRMSDQMPQAPEGQAPPAPDAQPRPPQSPEKKTYLQNYEAVIAVGSGKGGVGKSTVAINLAVTLAKMGHRVSMFDSDIYGPSLPIMMGLRNTRPTMNDDSTIIPLHKHGLHVMSIGNVVEEAAATVWRGPIVHQVIDQLLRDTQWPGGDFMVIDMPPGTGDAQLTLSQVLEITGAVIVSTPQDVALIDAIKSVSMFHKVEVPVIGMVENMSGFVCPNCNTETEIFDKGNAERASGQNNIPFLGRIPLETAIREGGDFGTPIAVSAEDSPTAEAFRKIAVRMIEEIERL